MPWRIPVNHENEFPYNFVLHVFGPRQYYISSSVLPRDDTLLIDDLGTGTTVNVFISILYRSKAYSLCLAFGSRTQYNEPICSRNP